MAAKRWSQMGSTHCSYPWDVDVGPPSAQVKNYSVKFIFDDFLIAKPRNCCRAASAPPSFRITPGTQSEPQTEPWLRIHTASHIMLRKVLSMASLSSVLTAIGIIIINIIIIPVYISFYLHPNCTRSRNGSRSMCVYFM